MAANNASEIAANLRREEDEKALNLIRSVLGGLMATPVLVLVNDQFQSIMIPAMLFLGFVFTNFCNVLVEEICRSNSLRKMWMVTFKSTLYFCLTGVVLLVVGLLVRDQTIRAVILFCLTFLLSALAILNWKRSLGLLERTTKIKLLTIFAVVMFFCGCLVGLGFLAKDECKIKE